MRPISVMSIWYRLLRSTIVKQDCVRTWLAEAMPNSSHGGLKGRSVGTACANLSESLAQILRRSSPTTCARCHEIDFLNHCNPGAVTRGSDSNVSCSQVRKPLARPVWFAIRFRRETQSRQGFCLFFQTQSGPWMSCRFVKPLSLTTVQ